MDEQTRYLHEALDGPEFERVLNATRRLRATLLSTIGVVVALLMLAAIFWAERFGGTNGKLIQATMVVVLMLGSAALILKYLEPRPGGKSRPSPLEMIYLGMVVARARRKGVRVDAAQVPAGVDMSTLVDELTKRVEEEAVTAAISQIEAQLAEKFRRQGLEDLFEGMNKRLRQETLDLARRANLNLLLGIFTTMLGMAVLAYAAFTSPPGSSWPEMLAHYVPKLSLALLVELFAYFFLRLYKESLSGIKYFQNELTNVESKHIALAVAFEGTPELQTVVVQALSNTERNFLLNKDQTTVELEKDRLANEATATLAGKFGDLIQRVRAKE